VPHLYWDCIVNSEQHDFPLNVHTLIDHGSHTVLIRGEFVTELGLRRRRLPHLETIELAMTSGKEKVEVVLSEWVKLKLHGLNSLYSA
jgi:hypothetical protein